MTRYLGDDWLLPSLDDLNRAWFTSGKITIQVCESCARMQHPPEEVCSSCQGFALGWRECSGQGHVESVAVVRHPLRPSLKEHVPYVVAVVSLDDAPGINAIGNVVNCPADEVAIGQAVRAVFQRVDDTEVDEVLQIPQWERV